MFAAVFALAEGDIRVEDVPRDPAYDRFVEAVIDAAEDSRNPRVLLGAASFATDTPWHAWPAAVARKRDALGARAMRLGADDPVIWYLLAVDCPLSKPACEAARAVENLRRVAPNNAIGWMLPAAGDDAGANFARAAGANRYDDYEGEFVRALFEAASAVEPPASFIADVRAAGVAAPRRIAHVALALGVSMAKAHPQMQVLLANCSDGNGLQGSGREACIAIGRLLLNRSRDELAQRLGTTLLLARLPHGQERSDVVAARRRLDWLREKELEVYSRDAYPASLMNWLHAGADRQSVTRAALSENGIPAEPPAGWQYRASSIVPAAPGVD